MLKTGTVVDAKVRYRRLAKNTARLTMLFALSNLWMMRRQLMARQGWPVNPTPACAKTP